MITPRNYSSIACLFAVVTSFILSTPTDALVLRKLFRFGARSMPEAAEAPNGANGAVDGANGGVNGANGAVVVAEPAPVPLLDKDIKNIFDQNQEWKAEKLSEDQDFFNKLGSIHQPPYMWIGCSDARVPANEIMGEDAGEVFVVRNVANMVVNTDFNLMAALQYAVCVLKVQHILVCGHYECGGVRASMEPKDHVPPLENWLRNIRDVYRLHKRELDAIRDPERRNRRLVELNTIEQCVNLFKTGVVQRRRVETYKEGAEYPTPRIHACIFDPKTGDMKRLQVNFNKYIGELHQIYDLYSLNDFDEATV